IPLRRIEAFLSERRRVVEMNEIVCDAGMARLATEDRLENRCSLELHRIGLIAGRCRDIEFDRIEDLRFIVIRIGLRHALHGLEVGKHAGAMIDLVKVGIERGQRIDEIALALSLCADRLALLDRRKAKRKIADRWRGVRIVEQAQRNAPIGDAAVRIGLEYLLEYFLRLTIPERMLI